MKRQPKILCISPFFAPLAGAEAFCGSKLITHLLKRDVDVTVLTIDYESHAEFKSDASDLWTPLYDVIFPIPPHGNLRKVLSPVFGLRYHTPDWARWIRTVIKTGKQLHEKSPFDVIYSRSFPNIAHVAGYWIAKSLRVPWIANLNDPWDMEGVHVLLHEKDSVRMSARGWISYDWMRRVLSSSDMLTFPCERLMEYHLRLVDTDARSAVLPHIGWSTPPPLPSNGFRLVHAGSLGIEESSRRDATRGLLEGVARFLDDVPRARLETELLLVGTEDMSTSSYARELGLDDVFLCTGRVSYQESLRFIASATVCIVVEGNVPEGIYLPSKVADYVSARMPVLSISPQIGTLADLSHDQGITRLDSADPHGIARAIKERYQVSSEVLKERYSPSDELVASFDGDIIANKFCEIVESLQ